MKLKKFAALALAGVMAVSMLAGCSGKSTNTNPSNPGTDDGETEVVPTSVVTKLFNDAQGADNKAKVVFTDDAKLESNFKKAVEMAGYYDGYNAGEVKNCYVALTGADANKISVIYYNSVSSVSTAFRGETEKNVADVKNGETNTYMVIARMDASKTVLSPDAAARAAAAQFETGLFDDLVAGSSKKNLNPGDPYLTYTYEGNACAVSSINEDGDTIYYVAVVLTQNVAKDTLKNPA